MPEMSKPFSRRVFLMGFAALGLTACATPPRRAARRLAPSDRLNVAGIGCGGKGAGDVNDVAGLGENIVALCDVDDSRAADTYQRFPHAKKYRDFRVMLDKHPEIDAVTVSTPDHMHAPAALWAMERGKHVFVQKPLCHTIYEARLLAKTAHRYRVATQMGNQGHAGEGVRQVCEIIWSNMIGPVREVHILTNRPIWPQNQLRPARVDEIPTSLDWDLWLGVAPPRPFVNGCYHPFNWRGWWDFGCGALGDMGCHVMDPAFWALKLFRTHAKAVELIAADGGTPETPPSASMIKYEFPAREDMPAATLYWYDGNKVPQREFPGLTGDDLNSVREGSRSLFVGDYGYLACGEYGGSVKLLPQSRFAEAKLPDPWLPRSPGHMQEWIAACKGEQPAGSNMIDYSGPLTEMVLLGNLAVRAGGRVEWDGPNMRVSNRLEISHLVTKEYRKGWGIG